MPKLFKQNQTRLLGIDIRSSFINLLEFGDDNAGILLKQVDSEPWSKKRTLRKPKGAAIAVNGMAVFSKTLSVDASLSDNEVEIIARSEVIKAMGTLREECYMDVHRISQSDADPKRLNLQVVAYRKDRIDRLIAVVASAGIRTDVVDIDYYALQRAGGLLSEQDSHNNHQRTKAIINIDSNHSTFVVFRGEDLIYTRSEYQNNGMLLARAMHYLGVCDWLRGYAERGNKQTRRRLDLAKMMAPAINEQLSRFLQFYSTAGHEQLDQLIISGDCVLVPEVTDYVQEQQRFPCMLANPFVNVRYSENVDAEFLEAVAPAFMLCSGLALRKYPNEYH